MKFWPWTNRRKRESDLNDEIESHLRMAAEDRAGHGESDEEARAAAKREFGNVAHVKETTRDMWGWRWLEVLLQDLRYGLRLLAKNPGFTAVAVLTLALGIGANTTIFSAVSALILRKPPVRDVDRLVTLNSTDKAVRGWDLVGVSPPDFESWRRGNHVFEDMAAAETGVHFTLTGRGTPESVRGDRVTPNFFSVLGLMPALGRQFVQSEGKFGRDHVVILSHDLWGERFGQDPNVVGKRIKIDGEPHTVVGVMPPESDVALSGRPRLWVPLVFRPNDKLRTLWRGNRYLGLVLGRLRPGVTVQQAQAEIATIAGGLAQTYPETNKDWSATVLTFREYLIRKTGMKQLLMFLMAMVGLVLLIACANIAGLLLSRGAARTHEMAVRSAVGAGRGRLVRQMLSESLLISAAGGAVGLMISSWGISLLRTGFNFLGSPRTALFHLNGRTLVFTACAGLATTVMFGLVPALRASRIEPGAALTEGGRAGSASRSRSRLRKVLVAGEVALALALLAATGIVAREARRELSAKTGFDPEHLLTTDLSLNPRQYRSYAAERTFFRQATEKLKEIPGVESAAVTNGVPFGAIADTSFNIVGRTPGTQSENTRVSYFLVGPGYFRTMEIPFERGRDFSGSDNADAPVVAIVSHEFARRYFPNDDAIGRQIEVDSGQYETARIVGVVGNVKVRAGQVAPEPQIYETYLQIRFAGMSLVARSGIVPAELAPSLRRAVWSVDKEQPVGRIVTMKELANESVGGARFIVALMGAFAVIALILAVAGIYGMVAYLVTLRTHEIGVRIALGARKRDSLGLVLRQGCLLIGAGCAIGLGLALPLPRLLTALFGGIAPQGPLMPIAAALTAAIVSVAAVYIPARRATKVDPMVALRYE